ncbi:hypothetical protein A3H80_00880 [Candidatus Roizmanbacteria bacterium RIFCSPLOWO2_02_FULL_37_19]|nr:MAG: hypothetical protein A2862_01930 [Candidatus Roizmanbacteria bacterium RIFCSPHIGHO2_01_FULL_38_41]OGK44228.1 MAG: hypothetical protein A2956_00040 [Candidatus Roizmanbacteria bacterium RIFCSPLOWO2_01_FULL_37_57]OGK54519.1 MAG: hypothetical protein A3H80_00880 [Candidatus Roizmanbacteria bacterium RIFCSPLOWO2_02_FULL_37_19]
MNFFDCQGENSKVLKVKLISAILQAMDDAKRVFAIFAALLLIIIIIGVVVNRVAKEKGNIPIIGGALERVLFPNRPTPKPEEKELVEKTDSNKEPAQGSDGSIIIKKTTSSQDSQLTESINESAGQTLGGTSSDSTQSKGGQQANSIPATGAPAAIIIFSLSGLVSGLYLKRKASI